MKCQWFALCDNEAMAIVAHPILEQVPACERCIQNLRDLGGNNEVKFGQFVEDSEGYVLFIGDLS